MKNVIIITLMQIQPSFPYLYLPWDMILINIITPPIDRYVVCEPINPVASEAEC